MLGKLPILLTSAANFTCKQQAGVKLPAMVLLRHCRRFKHLAALAVGRDAEVLRRVLHDGLQDRLIEQRFPIENAAIQEGPVVRLLRLRLRLLRPEHLHGA